MTRPAIGTDRPGQLTGSSTPARPSSAPPLTPAAPPSPKQQAVTFALELAKVRATGGVPGERATTADQLIADAKTIAAYLGQS